MKPRTVKHDARRVAHTAPMDGGGPRAATGNEILSELFQGLLEACFDDLGGVAILVVIVLSIGLFAVFGFSIDEFIEYPSLRKAVLPFATGATLVWGLVAARVHFAMPHPHRIT